MFNRLSVRLSLAFLLSAWIGIAAMILVVQRTLDAGFRQYLTARDSAINPNRVARLEAYYVENNTFAGAETLLSGRGSADEAQIHLRVKLAVEMVGGNQIVEVQRDLVFEAFAYHAQHNSPCGSHMRWSNPTTDPTRHRLFNTLKMCWVSIEM